MDVNFTAAELGIIGALLGALATTVTVLWRTEQSAIHMTQAAMQSRVDALIIDRNTWRSIAEDAIAIMGDSPEGQRLRTRLNDHRLEARGTQ